MSTLLFSVLIGTVFLFIYLYIKSAFSYWKRKGIAYLEPSFPFGNVKKAVLQKTSFAEQFEVLYNSSNEPVIGFYTFFKPSLLIRHPKVIQEVLIKNFPSFSTRGFEFNEKVDPMANNILMSPADKWRPARKQLTPAFTSGKLKEMFESIFSCTKSLNNYVAQYTNQNKTVEMREACARFATNVIASVAFGIEIDCIEDVDSEFREYGRRFFDPGFKNALRAAFAVFAPKWSNKLGIRFVDKDVGDFMIETIKQNLNYREKNNIQRKDVFQLLMQLRNHGKISENDNEWSSGHVTDNKLLSIEDMAAHAFIFFAGGYESSSTTMSFALYELAKNPHIQQKAYDEICSVLEKHDGQFTYDSVAEMKYMENCIEETLRMHAPIGFIMRKCTQDVKLTDSNITIEKGTSVTISVNGLHYDEQFYDEPKKFKPERFDEKRNGNKSQLEMPFLTFGDGPRNCVGLRLGKLQSKLAVVTLLKQFRFELGEQHLNKEMKLSPKVPTRCPINGINLKVFLR